MTEEKRDGCVACLTYLFVMLNATFLLAGLLLTLLGVWFYSVPANRSLSVIVYETAQRGQLETMMLFVICVGSGVCFTAIASCCAAFSQSKCMLITILLAISLLFLAEVFVTGLGLVFISVLKSGINYRMTKTLATGYEGDSATSVESVAWREVQTAFFCCGVNTVAGYQNHTNVHYEGLTGSLWYRTRSNSSEEEWPMSCCSKSKNGQTVGKINCTQMQGAYLNEAGCQEKTEVFVESHLMTVVGMAVFILVLHAIAAVLCYKMFRDISHPHSLSEPVTSSDSRHRYDQFENVTGTS